jgi:hypothetical protein
MWGESEKRRRPRGGTHFLLCYNFSPISIGKYLMERGAAIENLYARYD